MIRTIAIDDEPPALKVLQDHAAKLDFMQIEKCFSDSLEGLNYLQQSKIDAVFLDIKMAGISGIDVAEMISNDTRIIFTTAYPEHAVKGFDLNALDYLLKPVSFTRFLKACHKLKDSISKNNPDKILLLKEGNNIVRLSSSEIYFIEAVGNYLKVHNTKGVVLHRETMKEIADILPTDFIRIHKSFIVNMQHISRIEPFQLTIDNTKLPVSPNYKNDLWRKLGIK